MNKELKIFNYNGAKVRTVMQNGELWFIAKDVAEALGYERTADAIKAHVDKEDKLTRRITDSGQAREVFIINEAGVYSLIFSSKLPSAKDFKHWVTHEVLPDIRKHGMYLSDKAEELYKFSPESFNLLLDNYVAERDKNKELQKTIDTERPFSILGHMVLALPESMTVKDAADLLAQHGIDIGQNRLFKRLRDDGWVCKRKGKQWNKPTKKAIDNGFLNVQIENGFNTVTMVLPKGLQFFSDLFVSEEYPLVILFNQGETA